MPVEDHAVHEKVKISDSTPYGCHSREGVNTGYFAPDRRYKPDGTFYVIQIRIPHTMSKTCRSFYLWDTDPRCAGCTADKDFEYRDRMVALK
jgi:hypothetical protein